MARLRNEKPAARRAFHVLDPQVTQAFGEVGLAVRIVEHLRDSTLCLLEQERHSFTIHGVGHTVDSIGTVHNMSEGARA